MKKFLKKRWHHIPVGIVSGLLALVLVAGGAFATYNWLNFNIEVGVKEPLTIEFNTLGLYSDVDEWIPVGEGITLEMWGHAGNDYNIQLRINNDSRNPLTVKTTFGGDIGNLTFTGWPDGLIPADVGTADAWEWVGTANIKINNDAMPTYNGDEEGTPYTVTVTFTRE